MRSAYICIVIIACIALVGCGKKGAPQPRSTSDIFTWEEASANATGSNECLHFSGTLQGNLRNIDAIAVELQTAGSITDCPTCPFNPNERVEFRPEELGLTSLNGTFSMNYCPTHRSDAYRWRMVGENVFTTLEHAITPVRGVEME